MPLYEYECVKCSHFFEKIEKVSAPRRRKCPRCRGRAERRFAAPAIQFKGSGWYVSDYSRKGAAPADKTTPSDEAAAKETEDSKEAKETKEKKEPSSSRESPKKAHRR